MKELNDNTDKNKHKDINSDAPYNNLKIVWKKSKEEIWDELEGQLEEDAQEKETKIIQMNWMRYAAAIVLLAVSGVLFMRFYFETVAVPSGEHASITLPDGSKVNINANSTLIYNPLWWKISRNLKLTGEAFFEVEKGNSFKVESEFGETSVLGTSFNIYSRDSIYSVTCVSGKVKVEVSETENQIILNPNEKANLNRSGTLDIDKNIKSNNETSWINNNFSFTGIPFKMVIEEVARQYNVKIILNDIENHRYTGYFSGDREIEEVLTLICSPFNITFTKDINGQYILKSRTE